MKLSNKKSKKRKKLMKLCGLHDYSDTSHCFTDSTHHTCCLLGPDARKFADSTCNSIGTAAEKAYNLKKKKTIFVKVEDLLLISLVLRLFKI